MGIGTGIRLPDLTGRASLSSWWKAWLLAALANLPAMLIDAGLLGQLPFRHILALALTLPVLAYLLAMAIRRLYDRNRGAIWLLVFFLPPLVVQVGSQALGDDSASPSPLFSVRLLIAALPMMWGMVEICVLRSTPGDNRFGPNPRPSAPPALSRVVVAPPEVKSNASADLIAMRTEFDAAIHRHQEAP